MNPADFIDMIACVREPEDSAPMDHNSDPESFSLGSLTFARQECGRVEGQTHTVRRYYSGMPFCLWLTHSWVLGEHTWCFGIEGYRYRTPREAILAEREETQKALRPLREGAKRTEATLLKMDDVVAEMGPA